MTTPAFFRWEKPIVNKGNWNPTVYYGEKPRRPAKHDEHLFTEPQLVPPECFGANGEPLWSKLRELFPMPGDNQPPEPTKPGKSAPQEKIQKAA